LGCAYQAGSWCDAENLKCDMRLWIQDNDIHDDLSKGLWSVRGFRTILIYILRQFNAARTRGKTLSGTPASHPFWLILTPKTICKVPMKTVNYMPEVFSRAFVSYTRVRSATTIQYVMLSCTFLSLMIKWYFTATEGSFSRLFGCPDICCTPHCYRGHPEDSWPPRSR
jgi:hypothetical protein